MAGAQPQKKKSDVKEFLFSWEGKDKKGKKIKGELRVASESVARVQLRNKGIEVLKIKKQTFKRGKKITGQDITMFTRQLATMMKSGVPLLQSFDIVGQGHANPAVGKLVLDIKASIETGASLSAAFREHSKHFDDLYCNLLSAGEQAGILDQILDRLATYQEKTLAIKAKIKSALMYPIAVVGVALIVVTVIMIFVIPAFKSVFSSFGADLPAPTQLAIDMSDFMVSNWYIVFGLMIAASIGLKKLLQTSKAARDLKDRITLKLPVFGSIINKAAIARWSRTLSTMFSAGVPLVEALDSVAGAAGNVVYYNATKNMQREISTGTSLAVSMQNTEIFPNMVVQMAQIGEESGSLDGMLGKVADFYEREVDDAVESLSKLMEPLIILFLGVIVGGLVVAMYLPIFKLGSVV